MRDAERAVENGWVAIYLSFVSSSIVYVVLHQGA